MYKTGDLNKNLEKLKIELKQIKYPDYLDVEEASRGSPIVYLPILHYSFLVYSTNIAQMLAENGYVLLSKSDKEFIEIIFRALIKLFNFQPALNARQFFLDGFAEAKAIFCVEVIRLIKKEHNELIKKLYTNKGTKVISKQPKAVEPTPIQQVKRGITPDFNYKGSQMQRKNSNNDMTKDLSQETHGGCFEGNDYDEPQEMSISNVKFTVVDHRSNQQNNEIARDYEMQPPVDFSNNFSPKFCFEESNTNDKNRQINDFSKKVKEEYNRQRDKKYNDEENEDELEVSYNHSQVRNQDSKGLRTNLSTMPNKGDRVAGELTPNHDRQNQANYNFKDNFKTKSNGTNDVNTTINHKHTRSFNDDHSNSYGQGQAHGQTNTKSPARNNTNNNVGALEFSTIVNIMNELAGSVKQMTTKIENFKSTIEERVGKLEAEIVLVKNRVALLEASKKYDKRNVDESRDSQEHIVSFADEMPKSEGKTDKERDRDRAPDENSKVKNVSQFIQEVSKKEKPYSTSYKDGNSGENNYMNFSNQVDYNQKQQYQGQGKVAYSNTSKNLNTANINKYPQQINQENEEREGVNIYGSNLRNAQGYTHQTGLEQGYPSNQTNFNPNYMNTISHHNSNFTNHQQQSRLRDKEDTDAMIDRISNRFKETQKLLSDMK